MKIHREKVKKRNKLQKLRKEKVLGLYFDGRTDKTAVNHKKKELNIIGKH